MLSESSMAYPDGILSAVNRYTYDAKGMILKEEELSGTKIPVSRKEYLYDKDILTGVSTFNSNGDIVGKVGYEYASGRLVRETLFNANAEVQSTIDYTYDAAGRKLSRLVKAASGNQVMTEYGWDKGILVKVSILDAGKNIIKRYDRIYDKDGLLVREDEYGSDNLLVGKTVYTYNGKVLVREEKQNESGASLSAINYVNDVYGNPVEIDYVDRLGKLLEIKRQTWQAFIHTVQDK